MHRSAFSIHYEIQPPLHCMSPRLPSCCHFFISVSPQLHFVEMSSLHFVEMSSELRHIATLHISTSLCVPTHLRGLWRPPKSSTARNWYFLRMWTSSTNVELGPHSWTLQNVEMSRLNRDSPKSSCEARHLDKVQVDISTKKCKWGHFKKPHECEWL